MTETIKSKDTQLAVLRVRFDETDNEIKQKRSEIETLKTESDRHVYRLNESIKSIRNFKSYKNE